MSGVESVGWGGKFWIHNGTALQQILNATEVGLPEDKLDVHETTTLAASGRRKTYIAGLIDGGSFSVSLNHIANSADDILLRTLMAAAGTSRAFKIAIPDETGTPYRMYTGTVIVEGYKINPIKPNDVMTSELTLRVSGAVTEAAYS
jgi:hypothetical protein